MEILLQMISGVGEAAQIATFAVLVMMRKDNRQTQQRVKRIEKHLWPAVFGSDACEN